MKKVLTELVSILDKSGSMGGLETDTIGGYNSMLEKQKALKEECRITTVLFDNQYELLHDRIDLKAVSTISEKEYQVGGSTALLDAIGKTIHKITNVLKHTDGKYQANKVMFVIITDGEENSSREYSFAKIKSLIEKLKTENNWEFVFLGANIDAIETASKFGIAPDRAVDYLADEQGTRLNYAVMSDTILKYRKTGTFDETALDEIRKDVKRRKI